MTDPLTSPETFFGHRLGADRKIARWDKIAAYFNLLSKESDRIKVIDMGPSTDGAPFLLVVISSPENISRLDEIREANLRLSDIVATELAGVVKFTHFSLMVTGPYRIPIVEFLQAQAMEALQHAQQAGEILTGLGGHPSLDAVPLEETHKHSLRDILEESLDHELRAIDLYQALLESVENRSIYLEEYARSQIGAEELHVIQLRKMLRDYE